MLGSSRGWQRKTRCEHKPNIIYNLRSTENEEDYLDYSRVWFCYDCITNVCVKRTRTDNIRRLISDAPLGQLEHTFNCICLCSGSSCAEHADKTFEGERFLRDAQVHWLYMILVRRFVCICYYFYLCLSHVCCRIHSFPSCHCLRPAELIAQTNKCAQDRITTEQTKQNYIHTSIFGDFVWLRERATNVKSIPCSR